MRDRRNTNLSTCSASSCDTPISSASSSSSPPPLVNEKDFSSLPSPTLPLPNVTKENRARRPSHRVMAARIVACLCTLALAYRYFTSPAVPPCDHDQALHNISLTSIPSAIPVRGGTRWTVQIPHNSSFPLSTPQYDRICTEGRELSSSIAQSSKLHHVRDWSRASRHHDSTYLDLAEAQQTDMASQIDPPARDQCQSSLTFVLQEDDISFGKTILLLWMSYGLAKKEGRAFFIDDSKWAYGSFSTYFTPISTSNCAPPPSHHITPCPHNARHLLVSSSLAHWSFDAGFDEMYSRSRRHDRTFDLIRSGYEDLFQLSNSQDAAYIHSRVMELRANPSSDASASIGLHIRRGDLHPYEYQFSRDYLPIEHYADAARALRQRFSTSSSQSAPLILASDDPTLLSNPDLLAATYPVIPTRAQERILLASKEALDRSQPIRIQSSRDGAYSKYMDENSGWDGGFFPGLFFAMGGSTGQQIMQIRSLIARAYLLDLAVLAQGDGVVCAVSSATCRLLGVMLGREMMREGRWLNVDDGRAWSWDGRKWR